jgi:hypothetical protein
MKKALFFLLTGTLVASFSYAQEKKRFIPFFSISLNGSYTKTNNLNSELATANEPTFKPVLLGTGLSIGLEKNKIRFGVAAFYAANNIISSSENRAAYQNTCLFLGIKAIESEKSILVPEVGIGGGENSRIIYLNQPLNSIPQSIVSGKGNALLLQNNYTFVHLALKYERHVVWGISNVFFTFEVGSNFSLSSSEWKALGKGAAFANPTNDQLNQFYVQIGFGGMAARKK